MASMYLVLKLEGMNPQYCTGFENACVSWGGGGGGGRVKNWYFSLKDSEGGGISEIITYRKKKKRNRAFRNKAIRK